MAEFVRRPEAQPWRLGDFPDGSGPESAVADDIPLRSNYSDRAWELLHGTIRYVETRGVDQFSLAAAAEYLDTSSRMLIYHLGSRDEILGQVLALIRYRTLAHLNEPPSNGLSECAIRMMTYYLEHQWEMQLFFFVSTKAFEDAAAYEEFSRGSAKLWIDLLTAAAVREGRDLTQSVRLAAICLASIRGLLLDLFLTGDHERVNEAFSELPVLLNRAHP